MHVHVNCECMVSWVTKEQIAFGSFLNLIAHLFISFWGRMTEKLVVSPLVISQSAPDASI